MSKSQIREGARSRGETWPGRDGRLRRQPPGAGSRSRTSVTALAREHVSRWGLSQGQGPWRGQFCGRYGRAAAVTTPGWLGAYCANRPRVNCPRLSTTLYTAPEKVPNLLTRACWHPVAHGASRSRARARRPRWPLCQRGCHLQTGLPPQALAPQPVARSVCHLATLPRSPGLVATVLHRPEPRQLVASCAAQRENWAGNNAPLNGLIKAGAGIRTRPAPKGPPLARAGQG
jgi:hypothetical protein